MLLFLLVTLHLEMVTVSACVISAKICAEVTELETGTGKCVFYTLDRQRNFWKQQ